MSLWDQEALRLELEPVAQGNAGRTAVIDQLFDRCMADLPDPRLRCGAASVLARCLMLEAYPPTDDESTPSAVVWAEATHEPFAGTRFPIPAKIIA